MILGLSTGCVHKLINAKNKDEVLTLYRTNFKNIINAIEITIPENNLNAFKISKENLEWLKSLKFVSFHLLHTISSYPKVYKLLKENKIKVNHFVCHIDKKDSIPTFFKEEYGSRILYENIEDDTYNFSDIYNICFDVSHALKNGVSFLSSFTNLNEYSIKEIHLSNTIEGRCHELFFNQNNFNGIKQYVDLAKSPVIIESVANNLQELDNELKYINRKIFE